MNSHDRTIHSSHLAPPVFGTPEFDDLVAAIAAGAEARDRGEENARAAINLIRNARLGALRLPLEAGGAGASLPQLYRAVIALAEADSNIPHILRNHFGFVERTLRNQQSEKFRRWQQLIGQGLLFGSASGELGVQNIGSHVVETTLAPRGSDYAITGKKYYCTGNYYMDFISVRAVLPNASPIWAVIPTDRNGVVIEDDWDGIGQRLTASGSTVFKDATILGDETFLPAEEPNRTPYSAAYPQLWLTSIIVGILKAIVADSVALVKSRNRNYYHALTEKPAEDPLLQQTVGRLVSIAYVAEASVLSAAETLGKAYDLSAAGKSVPELFAEASAQAAKSKVVIDELALQAATQIFDVGGASATRRAFRLDRHWRNIRTIASHNPSSYKARALGDQAIFGTPLPPASFF
ncbi:acyl-CoA dehydrogenase [Rhizobium rhizogenes]|uniref:acyl-CoA dehydrogenase n=1 Tax=Rhizobium rhizogenes TaxID=359 RepID=UPI001571CE3D|nr:acyl-CoA dehydrogenase [Rhizobium rhizogenes]NTI78666.1 acyl-CoA dehydrogenase [Rhizobium rhizogenes]